MRSLFVRILVFSFLAIAVVVLVLSMVMNQQVANHFGQYIVRYHGGMHGMMMGNMAAMMGDPEFAFLASLRRTLMMVAGLMMIAGAAVSYWLARSISRPVCDLNQAVNAVAAGKLDITVNGSRTDEIGQLAQSFNTMTTKLKSNTVLRQRFLAGVAHELRTPLAILKANLEGIHDGVIKPDPAQLESLTEEVDRLTKIVEDLRDLSLLEAGQFRLEAAEVDMCAMIRNVVAKVKPLADRRQVHVHMELTAEPIFVWADPERVVQMLYNLVLNAIQYNTPGGSVTLTTTLHGGMVQVAVQDTGIGISAEDATHIFDHFYRVDPSRTKQSGGTGLGLAVVKQLAEAQHGRVGVHSIPNEGSTFTLELPRHLHNIHTISP